MNTIIKLGIIFYLISGVALLATGHWFFGGVSLCLGAMGGMGILVERAKN